MATETAVKATNIVWHEGEVTREERNKVLGQKGCTLWLTGLSGSGKSTVSVELEKQLLMRGVVSYRLDGDNIRHGLNKNLGFSAEDRTENIRRIGEVAKLMGDIGIISMTAFISPYIADRKIARDVHDASKIPFIEVHIDCPLEVAESRDPKGLYKKARAGQIKNFTGIDDPYEAPEKPEIVINTAEQTPVEASKKVIDYLVKEKIIPEEKAQLPEVAAQN